MKRFEWSRAAVAFLVVAASVGVLGGTVHATKLGDVDISGYVDVYGAANLNRPAAVGIPLHLFEGNEAFSLNRAEVVFDAPSFRADLGFGPTDGVVAAGGAAGGTGNLQQAYVKWPVSFGGRDLAIDVGKFVTHMGMEVIESKDNWVYSRGLLFQYAIPYTHTGLRVNTSLNSNWNAGVHIVSGWNNVVATQRGPGYGLQVIGKLMPQFGLVLNYMTGSHVAAGSSASVIDVVLTYDVNKQLSVAANVDSGSVIAAAGGATNNYLAWAIYGKYALANGTLVLRYESFDDPAETGVAAGAIVGLGVPTVTSLTVGYDMPVASNTTARVEYRMDSASTGTPFATSGAASASQSAITAALVTTF